MSIKLKLQSRQVQSLVLTPQMRQAIHILQLNNLELNEFLAEQVNENPFLEIDDSQNFDSTLDASDQENIDSSNLHETSGGEGDDFQNLGGEFLDNSFKSGNLPETHITESFYENLWDSDARQDLQNRPSNQGDASSLGDEKNNPGHVIEQSVSSCLLYTSPSPRDRQKSRMPSSA